MSYPKTKTIDCCVDAQLRPNLSWMFVTESNVTSKDDVIRTDLFVGLNFGTPNVLHV